MTNNEIAAWVSAAAAVIQAIGAIAAIIYSGKLARDSAEREKAADAAAARREEAAIAAQAEREQLAAIAQEDRLYQEDQEQQRLRRVEADERFNAPLEAAMVFGRAALLEIDEYIAATERIASTGDRSHRTVKMTETQVLLMERIGGLIEQSSMPSAAAALRRVQSAFAPPYDGVKQAAQAVELLRTRRSLQQSALDELQLQIRDEPGRY